VEYRPGPRPGLRQRCIRGYPKVNTVAEGCGRTPAQVLIRWHIQLGNIVIPKSVNPTRIASNLDVFDFELNASEMASISSLDDGTRLGPNPRTFTGGE
jgi:2,5-diketo-D-gluconate reductase A